ncbi:hypothetical protein DFH28DRAFT_1229943 [Melampsora americana]|nr:hypothetical protein DFH28DRAFT_1229943 [Melampsora americana]
MLLRDFVKQLNSESPHLSDTLQVADFLQFAYLASKVHDTAAQSLGLTATRTTVLPFLETVLSPPYSRESMADLWRVTFPYLPDCQIDASALIQQFGLHPQLTNKLPERFLRAPLTKCLLCPQAANLHIHSRNNGYLYDTDGCHAIETVILCCSNAKCGTFYRPSYYTQGGLRIYYTKEIGRDTGFLHIHCHYYMTYRLSNMFRVLQMLAHVSHFNLVNWFNELFVDEIPVATFKANQGFHASMSEEVCRDGLILHSLINHADRRQTRLAVAASGNDTIRFDSAIEAHLELLSAEGTRFRDHYCSKCVRLIEAVDPDTGKPYLKAIRAIVTDGLTIGHWRCSASTQQLRRLATAERLPAPEGPCTNKLTNINDRYCPHHFMILGGLCRAQPCSSPALPNSDTCGNIEHVEAWAKFNNRTKANFSLSSILNRPGSNLPTDTSVHLNPETAEFRDLESLQQDDESHRAHESARDGGESQAADKPLFSRLRTHNDQLAVATCGITVARKTFYNAESVSAVKEFLEESFPRGMPEVVFYDNACRLTEHIYNGTADRSAWEGTVIPVDPFHHRSHAESDEFCKRFTDPKLFPDIQEGGRWIFNASAGELTNIWYGGWLTKKLDKRPDIEYLGEAAL